MRVPRWCWAASAVVVLGAGPSASYAWNDTGHRVIASVACRQLDEATRARVADLLRKHPAYAQLWVDRPANGPDDAVNLFGNASVFPDDARRSPWDRYHRGPAHYVNFRILADEGNRIEPPVEAETILNSYAAHRRKVADLQAPAGERALSLSWMFHQEGDIHQPLHAVCRVSKALPEGDRGGNSVSFPNPRARAEWGNNLHAYWDDLIGTDDRPATVAALAEGLMAEHPRQEFAAELQRTSIREWAEEGVAMAVKTVYNNLDPTVTKFADRPIGYEADARRAARRRAALAGYRLADELKRLFGSP